MKSDKSSGFALFHVIVLVLCAIGAGGWIMNIIKLFNSSFDPLTGEVILRTVGIFVAPLGAIMGFL